MAIVSVPTSALFKADTTITRNAARLMNNSRTASIRTNCNSTPITTTISEIDLSQSPFQPRSTALKTKLLSCLAGLNRGFLAKETDLRNVANVAKELEDSSGSIDLSIELDKLQGTWRLIYSSAFASGSLGGFRPGPPTGRLPITLGQVYQRIDIPKREFDNIVDLQIGTLWPLPQIEVTATLAHIFEVIGRASIKINFEKTIIQPAGSLSQIPLSPLEFPRLPDFLRPPNTGSGDFEVTFLDEEIRITRGDRGELRVFLKT